MYSLVLRSEQTQSTHRLSTVVGVWSASMPTKSLRRMLRLSSENKTFLRLYVDKENNCWLMVFWTRGSIPEDLTNCHTSHILCHPSYPVRPIKHIYYVSRDITIICSFNCLSPVYLNTVTVSFQIGSRVAYWLFVTTLYWFIL